MKMDPLSKAFNWISDPKRVPHVNGKGHHPNHSPVQAFFLSPQTQAGLALGAFLGTMIYASFPNPLKYWWFIALPIAMVVTSQINPFEVYRHARGQPSKEAERTVYKRPGITSLAAMEAAANENRVYWRWVTPFRAVMLTGMGMSIISSTESVKQAALVSIGLAVWMSPMFVAAAVEDARNYLRNRMIIKGHWHAIEGRTPPRIGPDKPEASSQRSMAPSFG